MSVSLTAKQQRFVQEYLIDLNGKQAAIRTGYSVKRAEVTASELLATRKVSEAIDAAMAAREQRTEITQDRVLKELARVAFFDIRKIYNQDGTLKSPHEMDDDAAAALAGIDVTEEYAGRGDARELVGYTKKAKIPDKVGALSLAMRHLGMLKDKTELSGPNGGPIPVAPVHELSEEALIAIAALGAKGK